MRGRAALDSVLALLVVGALGMGACVRREAKGEPRIAAGTPEAAGRYLAVVGGCNDCHTPAWGKTDGAVADAEWFTGNPVGFRGEWGTTYAANLRVAAADMTEDQWLALCQGGGKPPMPWMNLKQTNPDDLRALYRFLLKLGRKGEAMPESVPPGQEPKTAYRASAEHQPKAK